jgi:hypothetical protein
MRHHIVFALIAIFGCTICRAQPVHLTLGSSVHDGVLQGFHAGLALDVFNPWGTGSYGLYGWTRLISPGAIEGNWASDTFGSWGGGASTREGALALMNGRWTLQYEDAFDGSRAEFYFDVSVSGVDANDLAPVVITSPLSGSGISPTPTILFETAFPLNSPDDGVGYFLETFDTQRVNNGRCTFTRPLRNGTYTAGIYLFREQPIDEVFAVSNAGYSGVAYGNLNFTPGPLRLSTSATVSGLVVPAPGAATLLGFSALLAVRRRR